MLRIIIFLLFPSILLSQATIIIDQVPSEYTPLADELYLVGDFNGWNPNSSSHKFVKDANGEYRFTINGLTTGNSYNYKITRGSWATVETNASGGFLPDRSLVYQNGLTIRISVAQWDDMEAAPTTSRSGYVFVVDTDFVMTPLNRTRKIWVYLPQDYFNSTSPYPVMYMQDGQNLFDTRYAFSGEWQVDESLTQLENNGQQKCIVVGVDNGGGSRIDEYSPWVNAQYGGGQGDDYMDFVVNTLKPFIDANFRTQPGRETTAIMGSSMGGLISYYGGLRFQQTFSKVGVFSPSLWFSQDAVNYPATTGRSQPMRFYFLSGTNESSTMVSNMQAARQVMLQNGFSANEVNLQTRTDGQHSEWFWAREFRDAYIWLFTNPVTNTEAVVEKANRFNITIEGKGLIIQAEERLKGVSLFDEYGRVVLQTYSHPDLLNLGDLPIGVYFINGFFEDGRNEVIKFLLR